MDQFLKAEQQDFVGSFKNIAGAGFLSEGRSHSCSRCGATMRYFDAILWIDGSNSGRPVRLPFCSCPENSASSAEGAGVDGHAG